MLALYRVQWAGFNTIPASHAQILKYYGRFKRSVYLLDNFTFAGRYGGTDTFFRIALTRITLIVIHHSE